MAQKSRRVNWREWFSSMYFMLLKELWYAGFGYEGCVSIAGIVGIFVTKWYGHILFRLYRLISDYKKVYKLLFLSRFFLIFLSYFFIFSSQFQDFVIKILILYSAEYYRFRYANRVILSIPFLPLPMLQLKW